MKSASSAFLSVPDSNANQYALVTFLHFAFLDHIESVCCRQSRRTFSSGTFSRLYPIAFSRYAARMQVDNDDLEEFRTLYTAEFGEVLSNEEACEIAGRVADLYSLLAETLPSERVLPAMPRAAPDDFPSLS